MNYSFNIEIAEEYNPFRDMKECNTNPCIYFLINVDRVVYVGKSKFGISRIGSHCDDKIFTHYSQYSCPIENMRNLEAYFIHTWEPEYNYAMPTNDLYISQPMAKREYNIYAQDFKKMLGTQRPAIINGVPYWTITDEMREAGVK